MSYIFLSIVMHLILTMHCSYVKFINQMVAGIKVACLVAACGEAAVSGGFMCPWVESNGPFCSHLGNLAFGPYAPKPIHQ